jgi:DNA replication licensing factor MCM7
MALLHYRTPVDYHAQQEAFKDFLETFKSFESTTDAIEDLHIDGDGTSDEYDFMDDADGTDGQQTRSDRRKEPKRKYMKMLQDVADRDKSNILIELDDLDTVSLGLREKARTKLTMMASTRDLLVMNLEAYDLSNQ